MGTNSTPKTIRALRTVVAGIARRAEDPRVANILNSKLRETLIALRDIGVATNPDRPVFTPKERELRELDSRLRKVLKTVSDDDLRERVQKTRDAFSRLLSKPEPVWGSDAAFARRKLRIVLNRVNNEWFRRQVKAQAHGKKLI
jgi:hypothetical protein